MGSRNSTLLVMSFQGLFTGCPKIDLIDGPKAGHTSVHNHKIVYILFEKACNPGCSPVLAIEGPFVDYPGVDTISIFGDDFKVSPHRFHKLTLSIDLVFASMFI